MSPAAVFDSDPTTFADQNPQTSSKTATTADTATTATTATTLLEGRFPLTAESAAEIAAIPDPALRNLWITQGYADLGRRLLDVFPHDLTWCSFAVWASNTAGLSIRGEELPRSLTATVLAADDGIDALVRQSDRATRVLQRLGLLSALERSSVERLFATAIAQVSAHIAHGNALVFAELAPKFVAFLELVRERSTPISADDLVGAGVLASADDDHVRIAFTEYVAAINAPSAHLCSQHVLAANIAAVLHEQRRLQSDVAAAMNAGLVDVGSDVAVHLHHLIPEAVRRRIATFVQRRIVDRVERMWGHIATSMLMTLDAPGQTLHLGRDVPLAPNATELFGGALRRIDLDSLQALLDRWDPTGGTGRGSGAHDWSSLDDRMGYIVNLFRSRQTDLSLAAAPFDDDDLSWMVMGRIPRSM